MTKKLMCVFLTLILFIISSIGVYAEPKITGDFFIKNIKINGELIINYELQNSFFMYKNSLYMPLTPDMAKICGIYAEMDWNSNTLKLEKSKITQKNITDRWIKNDNNDIVTSPVNNAKVLVYDTVKQADDVIGTVDIATEQLNLNGLPLLASGKTVFIPMSALKNSSILDFDIYYDNYYGACISTIPGKTAKSYFKQGDADYFEGLAKYMKIYNPSLGTAKALEYVYLFKRAGKLNGVDEKLLMGIAQKESKFNPHAVSKGGAVGMMQIMPGTAKTYGVSYSQLLNPKINIEFGAMYIGNAIKRYSGNTVKGLSAYNQGGGSVDRGSYSTNYASKVISMQSSITQFVKNGRF